MGAVPVHALLSLAVQRPHVSFVGSHNGPFVLLAQSVLDTHWAQDPADPPEVTQAGVAAATQGRLAPLPRLPLQPAHTLFVGALLQVGVEPAQLALLAAVQVPQVNFVGSHSVPPGLTAQSRSLLHWRHACAVLLQTVAPGKVEQSLLATQPPHWLAPMMATVQVVPAKPPAIVVTPFAVSAVADPLALPVQLPWLPAVVVAAHEPDAAW